MDERFSENERPRYTPRPVADRESPIHIFTVAGLWDEFNSDRGGDVADISVAEHASPQERALVERVRERVRVMQYTPLNDAELEAMVDRIEFGAADAETEGVIRTPVVAAFHAMLYEERVPDAVHDSALDLFLEMLAEQNG